MAPTLLASGLAGTKLAGWFQAGTGMNNSTFLVQPKGETSDNVIISHVRRDGSPVHRNARWPSAHTTVRSRAASPLVDGVLEHVTGGSVGLVCGDTAATSADLSVNRTRSRTREGRSGCAAYASANRGGVGGVGLKALPR
jgi:hypothetical protein